MVMMLARYWWVLTLRGLAAILFGVLCFAAPGLSLLALVIFFGVYAIVDGVMNIGLAVRARHGGRRSVALLVEGIASAAAGVIAFLWPGLTALALLLLIAAWAVVTGIAEVAAALRLRRTIRGEWLLGLSGVLSIAFGVLLFLFPRPGALAVVFWIGAYAILFGALLAGLSLRLRAWARAPERHLPTGRDVTAPA